MKPHLILVVVFASVFAVLAHVTALLLIGTAVLDHNQPPRVAFVGVGGQKGVVMPFAQVEVPQEQVATREDLRGQRGPMVPVRDYTFTGPVTHGNMALFLIHGPDMMREQRMLPLHAALAQNLAVVHGGGIAIDNRAEMPLFIQAGDIIKGGTQDRVIPYDQIIPIGTMRRHLDVFCVEAGRCGPRGQETSTAFETATEQLPGRRLHLAARYRKSQQDVWNGVQELQHSLGRSLGGPVQAPLSPTSLQLTLETGLVQRALQDSLDDFIRLPERGKNAIGVAVVLNGQIQGADVYASSDLFQDLWPKLLRAHAVAALAERQEVRGAPVSADAVRQFLLDAENGAICRRESSSSTLVLRQESAEHVIFDTCDPARGNLVVHRSFLAK